MKIIILGAAAQMAQPALHYLVKQKEVKEIILTDLNEKKLQTISEVLGEKVSYKKVNIKEKNEWDTLLKDVTLMMNFIGPYYRFQTIALERAIEHGVHYIDLCDDYDVTKEALQLNERAKENNVLAITGMGASPGITNVLAKLGADQLEEVNEINTYWVVGDAEPSGFGALIHMFHIMKGKIPTFKDGEEIWIRAFQQDTAQKINFGYPVGEVTLYHVGHPEPVTLPNFIPNVKKVTNLGALLPAFQNPMFKSLVDLGLTSEQSIMFKGIETSPLEFLLNLFQIKQDHAKKKVEEEKKSSVSAAKIEVLGKRNGKVAKYVFTKSAFDQMDQGTSIPAGVVAVDLLKGKINATGVIPPEALNPKEIIVGLRDLDYFAKDRSFQVKRQISGKVTEGSIIEESLFPEFWQA